MPDLVAAGTVPDIVTNYEGPLSTLNDLGLTYNMEPLIQKHKFDINRIEPQAIETAKVGADQTYIAALPSYTNAFALFYNKTIFDHFGVPYPKDGMTWEDVHDLAIKVTKNENGTQFRGFYPDAVARGAQQLGLNYVDFKTNQATMDTDQWRQLYQLWLSFFDIPGNADGALRKIDASGNLKAFTDGQMAMITGYSGTLNTLAQANGLNWDMVTYPQNKALPGYGQRVDSPFLSVTSSSQHKDEAFEVIATILSDAVQTDMCRHGRMSILKDPNIKQQFGLDTPFKDKNIKSMAALKFTVMSPMKFLGDSNVNTVMVNAFNELLQNQKDVNSAMRDANDAMNQLIQTQMQKK
ncbi:MAG: transporter substrate-binding protein [Bacilli bacterium]|nr:transporter substrate-binding protein [Bacilli bacterium]